MFGWVFFHFFRVWSLLRYFVDHCLQKFCTTCWTSCHLENLFSFNSNRSGSTTEVNRAPMRKCPGINSSRSDGSRGHRRKGSGIQIGFDLSNDCPQFLRVKCCCSKNPAHVIFSCLYGWVSQATKMGGVRRDYMPIHSFVGRIFVWFPDDPSFEIICKAPEALNYLQQICGVVTVCIDTLPLSSDESSLQCC